MEGAHEETEEYVRAVLTGLSPEDRMVLIGKIRAILDSELLRSNYDIPDTACPICGCTECIRCVPGMG